LPDYPDNPLFKYEIRQVRWAETPERLKRYSILVFMLIQSLVLVLWLLLVLRVQPSNNQYPDSFRAATEELTGWLALISIVANGLLDLGCVLVTVNCFVGEITAHRWDLLRLAALNSEIIVLGKYAVAQCSAWRFAILVISLRVSVVFLFAILILTDIVQGQGNDLSFEFMGLFAALPVIAIVYVVEPYWRLQAYAMLILNKSYGKSSLIRVSALALSNIVSLWIVQIIVFGIVFYAALVIAFGPFGRLPFIASWVFFVNCLAVGFALRWFYLVIGKRDSLEFLIFRINHDLADFN
jgi:hypothetical protein